jgi:hypothetical protein
MNMVQYLGYIVDEHGVHVDLAKIQVIRDWLASTTLTELRSFLTLAKFYRGSCWDSLILHGPSAKLLRVVARKLLCGGSRNIKHSMIGNIICTHL